MIVKLFLWLHAIRSVRSDRSNGMESVWWIFVKSQCDKSMREYGGYVLGVWVCALERYNKWWETERQDDRERVICVYNVSFHDNNSYAEREISK